MALGLIDRTTSDALKAIRETRNKAAYLAEPIAFDEFKVKLIHKAGNVSGPNVHG